MNNTGKYDDIINLPRHISKKHPQMSLKARSAQFAPFAALTGYDDAIKETSRFTDERRELNEEMTVILNEKLKKIQEKICEKPKIELTYFIKDLKKNGGEYVTITGKVKKIDSNKQVIVFENNEEINIADIVEILLDF